MFARSTLGSRNTESGSAWITVVKPNVAALCVQTHLFSTSGIGTVAPIIRRSSQLSPKEYDQPWNCSKYGVDKRSHMSPPEACVVRSGRGSLVPGRTASIQSRRFVICQDELRGRVNTQLGSQRINRFRSAAQRSFELRRRSEISRSSERLLSLSHGFLIPGDQLAQLVRGFLLSPSFVSLREAPRDVHHHYSDADGQSHIELKEVLNQPGRTKQHSDQNHDGLIFHVRRNPRSKFQRFHRHGPFVLVDRSDSRGPTLGRTAQLEPHIPVGVNQEAA